MKKVKRSQSWQNFAVAFGNSLAASNAGYSYSTTNSSVTGVTNSYGSASGYVGNTYGYASGYSSSYSTAYGRSSTSSYNGAAAYEAQQNANAQTNAYISNQYQIKNRLSEGYVKANTLANQTEFVITSYSIHYTKLYEPNELSTINLRGTGLSNASGVETRFKTKMATRYFQ